MNNKLPNVFVNNKAKLVKNNKETFYSLNDSKKNLSANDLNENDKVKKIIIKKKVSDMFSLNKYIYKIKVSIKDYNGNTYEQTLISKNQEGVLTINNKIIKYDEIEDIKVI